MKLIKKALLGLALAAAASVAGATEITDAFFLFPNMDTSSTVQTYSASVSGSDYSAQAGDTFVFDFLFQTPPDSMLDSLLFAAVADDPTTLSFSGATLYPANYLDFGLGPIAFPIQVSSSLVTGDGIVDGGGVYDLQLAGTFLDASGRLSLFIASDVASVPEPMSLSLIGLGLAGMAGLRRRKAA